MEDSIEARKKFGEEIKQEYCEDIDEALKNLLATIEGFRRDVDLAKKSDSPIKVHLETRRIFIPPAKSGTGFFAALSDTLVRTIKAFDGSIELGSQWQKNDDARAKAWNELYVIHENLVFVGAAGRILYDTLAGASRNFYEFNGNNDEVHASANIVFEEGMLDVCIVTTRSIIEHAVRLDIDIMEYIEKLRTDDKNAFI